jgi:hypothetical protein
VSRVLVLGAAGEAYDVDLEAVRAHMREKRVSLHRALMDLRGSPAVACHLPETPASALALSASASPASSPTLERASTASALTTRAVTSRDALERLRADAAAAEVERTKARAYDEHLAALRRTKERRPVLFSEPPEDGTPERDAWEAALAAETREAERQVWEREFIAKLHATHPSWTRAECIAYAAGGAPGARGTRYERESEAARRIELLQEIDPQLLDVEAMRLTLRADPALAQGASPSRADGTDGVALYARAQALMDADPTLTLKAAIDAANSEAQ